MPNPFRRPGPAALVIAFLLLSGCGSGSESSAPADDGTVVVGFSQVGAESAWRTAETASIRGEAERRGIALRYAEAAQRQANQVQAIRSFVAQGVDAIVLAPVVSTGWDPVLAEARRAGIPVVLVDRGIETNDPTLYATLIASDFVEEGRMAAAWLAERTGGTCRIVELQGTTGSAPAIDRQKGFAEVVAQHPGMSIVRSQSADFERAKGKEVMEAFLKAAPDGIDALYAHNDDMALGAIQAIAEAGLRPGTDILVVSIDAVRPAFEAMAEGTLNATVECNPLLGPIVFDTVERLLRGEEVPRFIKQEDRLFTQEQAADLLGERAY